MFNIGDCVANNDPDAISYNWHGTVLKQYPGNPEVFWIDWEERKQKDDKGRLKFKQSVVTARVECLRSIEPFTKTEPIYGK